MNTDDLVAHSRARFDYQTKKKLLREKYEAKMLFAWNGGMFRATPEMITFLNLYQDQDIVMPDLYGNPMKFNANDLCSIMKTRWQEQMNAWLLEYQNLASK